MTANSAWLLCVVFMQAHQGVGGCESAITLRVSREEGAHLCVISWLPKLEGKVYGRQMSSFTSIKSSDTGVTSPDVN